MGAWRDTRSILREKERGGISDYPDPETRQPEAAGPANSARSAAWADRSPARSPAS